MSLYDDVHRYEIGDLINLDVTFLDQSTGNPFDPEALSYTYKDPSGVIVTDVPSVKLSVGNYRAMVDATISGIGPGVVLRPAMGSRRSKAGFMSSRACLSWDERWLTC